MTLSHLVNPSQRWRVVRGLVPGCPVGSIVTLTTTDYRLDVSRPWFGVVAQLDLRIASISAAGDGHELTLGTATGEVVFENEDLRPALLAAPGIGPPPSDPSAFIGRVVQFGAAVPSADGLNLFVFVVLRRINGWLVGLTQSGHPAGIAENNIAWARVLEAGQHGAPDRLVLTWVGKRKECDRAFQAELPTLRELGYEPTSQDFFQEPRSTATVIAALLFALLLALVLIGIAILVWLLATKPPGVLTVTFLRVAA